MKRQINFAWLEARGFYNPPELREHAESYLIIFGIGFIMLLLAEVSNMRYLANAVTEGLGPGFWNYLGSMGIMALGIALVVPAHWLINVAHHFLSAAFSTGAWMGGAIFGGLIIQTPDAVSEYGMARAALLGSLMIAALVICLALNAFVGYLSWLTKHGDAFGMRIDNLPSKVRFTVAIFFALVPVLALLTMPLQTQAPT
jgi:hypothetical protein